MRKNKYRNSFLLILLLALLPLFSYAQDDKAFIYRQAKGFATALLNAKYDICVNLTDPFLVDDYGGNEATISYYKSARDLWMKMGLKNIDVSPVETIINFENNKRYALVPLKFILETDEGKIFIDSFLIAVSRKGFDSWFFYSEDFAKTIKQHSSELYSKLNPPEVKMYSEDKEFVWTKENGEWKPTPQTLEKMKKILEGTKQ